jgi:hypothetical protein
MQSQTGTATDASGRGRRRADRDSLGSRRPAHVLHPFHRHDATAFLILQKPLRPPRQSSRPPSLVAELRAVVDLILIQAAMCAGLGCTSNHVLRIASRTSEPTDVEYRRLLVAKIRARRQAEQPRQGCLTEFEGMNAKPNPAATMARSVLELACSNRRAHR